MKNGIGIILALFLLGCVNKHPYPCQLDPQLANVTRASTEWCLAPLQSDSLLRIPQPRLAVLSQSIDDYLKNNGFNTRMVGSLDGKDGSRDAAGDHPGTMVIMPKLILTMAEIDNNDAGWHGVSEDAFDRWSNFGAFGIKSKLSGAKTPAVSLYIEIQSNHLEYYENAGGIELTGKFNKFSMQHRPKPALVTDDDLFRAAMEIAFKPLLDTVK